MTDEMPNPDELLPHPIRRRARLRRPSSEPTPVEEVTALRDEFLEFRQGLVGSPDFPGGEILTIKNLIAAAAQNAAVASAAATTAAHAATSSAADAAKATAHLAGRVELMPDAIVAKINGTYVKSADLGKFVDTRIQVRRDEIKLGVVAETRKWFLGASALVAAGTVTWFVTTILPHIH